MRAGSFSASLVLALGCPKVALHTVGHTLTANAASEPALSVLVRPAAHMETLICGFPAG